MEKSSQEEDCVRQVILRGETMISEKEGELDVNKASSPSAVTRRGCDEDVNVDGVHREVVIRSLRTLKKSLDDQREKVMYMLKMVGAEETDGGGGGGDGEIGDKCN